MSDTPSLLMFMLSGVLLNLTPGPDVLYIVQHALRGGGRAGFVAAWGITAGCFVHVAAAAVGLGAVLATSANAFNGVKWVGVAYLLWAGARLLWRKTDSLGDDGGLSRAGWRQQTTAPPSLREPRWRSVFMGAFATNVLNPKVALFFLAFVPQFIPAYSADPVWSFVLLGCLFNLNGLLVCLGWAWGATWLSRRVLWWQCGIRYFDRLAGLMFVGFGLQLAWAEAPAA